MGWPEMAGKHKNSTTQVCGCRPFTGPIRARPAAAGWKLLPAKPSGRPPPPYPVRVQ